MADTGRGSLDSPWLADPRQLRKGVYRDDAGPATWSDWVFEASGGTSVAAQPTAGSLALTGAVPAITAAVSMAPSVASLTLAGAVPAVAAIGTAAVLPLPGALSLAGSVPAVSSGSAAGSALIGYGRFIRMAWTRDDQDDAERRLRLEESVVAGTAEALAQYRAELEDEEALLALVA